MMRARFLMAVVTLGLVMALVSMTSGIAIADESIGTNYVESGFADIDDGITGEPTNGDINDSTLLVPPITLTCALPDENSGSDLCSEVADATTGDLFGEFSLIADDLSTS